MAYDNTNRGTLSKNDKKTEEKHADYKGTANIDGTEFWISGWVKQGQRGTFLSLSFQEKDGQGGNKRQPARSNQPEGDLPF